LTLTLGETILVAYLKEIHMYNKWARGWTGPGVPPNSNTLERMHETLKGEGMFDHAEGLATVLTAAPLIGHRFSRHLKPLESVPTVAAESWKRGQSLYKKGLINLARHATIDGVPCIIIPSEEVIKLIPADITDVTLQVPNHNPNHNTSPRCTASP
jgi:hypothetical protein